MVDGRQGGRRGEGGRRQGWRGRAKPGNQLVIYIYIYNGQCELHLRVGE